MEFILRFFRPDRLPVWLVLAALAAPCPAATDSAPLTVMSFNIRYGAADDGDNSWPYRKDLVVKTIAQHRPSVFGVQECLWEQGKVLGDAFPEHQMTGAGRDDGQQKGEMCAIFTLGDRFDVLDEGTFWLSETPEVVGSRGWDAALPRIATWVKLKDRWGLPDTMFVFNAHFDHVGSLAREKSAELLRKRLKEIAAGYPIILMGDFNEAAVPANPPYRVLTQAGPSTGLTLHDSWNGASEAEHMLGEGTFNGFSGDMSRGRIDWILASGDFRILQAGIERRQMRGRYPSDHFPVWATYERVPRPAPAGR